MRDISRFLNVTASFIHSYIHQRHNESFTFTNLFELSERQKGNINYSISEKLIVSRTISRSNEFMSHLHLHFCANGDPANAESPEFATAYTNMCISAIIHEPRLEQKQYTVWPNIGRALNAKSIRTYRNGGGESLVRSVMRLNSLRSARNYIYRYLTARKLWERLDEVAHYVRGGNDVDIACRKRRGG